MQKRSFGARSGSAADVGGGNGAEEAIRALSAVAQELLGVVLAMKAGLPGAGGAGSASPVSVDGLAGTFPGLSDDATARFDDAEKVAKLQARGSGSALAEVYRSELDAVANLPGGVDSPLYAELQSKLRSAERSGFEQQTVEQYDLPNAHLKGELERAKLSPYGPSSIYALEEQQIALDERERRRLAGFEQQQRAEGALTEQEELKLTREQEELSTDERRATATVARGVADELPAVSANRPAGWNLPEGYGPRVAVAPRLAGERHLRQMGTFDSDSLAAMRGAHRQTMSLGEWESGGVGGDSDSTARGVPTATGTGGNTDRLIQAVERLTDALLHGGGRSGSALHPGEAASGLNGILQSNTLTERPDGYN